MLEKFDKYKIKKLSKKHIDEIFKLQNMVFAEGYTEDKIRFNTTSMFEDFFNENQYSIGLFCDENLIAFGLAKINPVQNELLSESEMKKILERNANFAIIKLIVVKKESRGHGLQRFILNYLETNLIKKNVNTFIASVSPINIYSLKNFIALDYKKIKRKRIYNNHDRYILLKEVKLNDFH